MTLPIPDTTNVPNASAPASVTAALTPSPASPPTPAASPAPSPAPPMTPSSPAAPASDPTSDPASSQNSGWGHAILQAMTGGPQYVIGEDGVRRPAPQTKMNLGRMLTATVLSGLLAPDSYRDTPFGPVRDYNGTAGNVYKASQAKAEEQRQKPQQVSDDVKTRKLQFLQNNAKAFALHTAQWHFKQEQYATNKPTIDATNNALEEYMNGRTNANDPQQPEAWLARGISAKDVISGGHKLTDSNVYQDGQTPDGEPTYAVINPKLENITLSKEATDTLARVNSAYRNVHAVVGGKVTMPMSMFISGMHDVAMVNSGREWVNKLNASADVNGKKAKEFTQKEFEDAVKEDPRALQTLWTLTHAVAGGNLPDQRADNLLATLAKNPGGDKILGLMGMTAQEALSKAEHINQARESQEALAKMGGIGPKAPSSPEQISNVHDTIQNNPELTQTQKDALISRFPAEGPDGQVHMTQGQMKDIEQAMQSFLASNKKDALAAGDPKAITESVNNAVFGGDVLNMKDLFTYARGNPTIRAQAENLLYKTAKDNGLDPNQYTMGKQQAKYNMQLEYSGGMKTKTGQQIVAFDTLLGHIQDAYEANNEWVRSNNPQLSKSQSWWARNMSNDQNYLRFQDDIIAPAKEYMNFLNANRAEHTEDITSLQRVLDPGTSPVAATQAMQSFLRTADVRAAALGDSYVQTMGKTYPIIDGQGAALLNSVLNGKSRAVAVSQPIPRGWVGGAGEAAQRSTPSREVLQTIFAAANGSKTLATRLANENGWAIPPSTKQQ